MNQEEMLDLVDEHDNIIDTLPRSEIYSKGLRYVRVIEAFIRDPEGRLWIPVRAPHKTIAPNGFDIGAGGHIEHGETPNDAFKKEVAEELDWDIDKLDWKLIGKFGPLDGLNTVSSVYEITSREAPELNPDDFVSARWMLPNEIVQEVAYGHPAKSNLIRLLELTYLKN